MPRASSPSCGKTSGARPNRTQESHSPGGAHSLPGGQEAQTTPGREKTCTCGGTGVTWPAGPSLFPHTAFTQNTSSCLHLQKALENCPALLTLPLRGIGSCEAWRASPIQCGGQTGTVKAHEGRIWRKPAATNPTTTRKPLINNQDGHHPRPPPPLRRTLRRCS